MIMIDEYLSIDVLDWCLKVMIDLYIDMKQLNINFEKKFAHHSQLHYQKYLCLRNLIYHHIASDSLSDMHETAHSNDDVHWMLEINEDNEQSNMS